MIHHIRHMAQRVRGMVTRGKVIKATLNRKRCLLQLSGLAGETKQKIELILTHGRSAFPKAGGDVVLLQVCGSRSHLVALSADDSALRIQDLQEGEFGDRDYNGQQIVFRTGWIEITTPNGKHIKITDGGDLDITVSGQVNLNVTGKVVGQASEWDLTGDVKVTGKITATDEITAKSSHTVSAHTHSDPQGGDVGPPTG